MRLQSDGKLFSTRKPKPKQYIFPHYEQYHSSRTDRTSTVCPSELELHKLMKLLSLRAVLFGQTGVGKSSVINMLLPDSSKKAHVSSSAQVATERSQGYKMEINDISIMLYDTAGLGGISEPRTSKAAGMLYTLIYPEGINFLIFVIRASGDKIDDLTSAITYNQMVHDVFCQKQVPVLLLVTNMDGQNPTNWWKSNEQLLQQLRFQAYACITAKRGRTDSDEDEVEYNRSKDVVKDALTKFCESHRTTCRPPVIAKSRIKNFLVRMFEQTFVYSHPLYEGIMLAEEKKSQAKKLANAIWSPCLWRCGA